MGSSMMKALRAPAEIVASSTARCSTPVMPEGTQTTTRGFASQARLWTFWMKYRNIFSVTSKSAMTPSFRGLIAMMWAGVRPIIRLASEPTARIAPVLVLIATTDGSLRTMPRPRTYTSVFAVPRSTAMSRPMKEKKLSMELLLRLLFVLFVSSQVNRRRDRSLVPQTPANPIHARRC
jgi:hypothetical protein